MNLFNSTEVCLELLDLFSRSSEAIPFNFREEVLRTNGSIRSIHQIHPYPAKLLPHIPLFFLSNEIFSKRGDIVLDPFCGSGTVLLEAQLAGRKSAGADINPFARLLTKAKVTPVDTSKLKKTKNSLFSWISNSNYKPISFYNIDYWFYPHIINQLSRIKNAINRIQNRDERDFFLICFSCCASKVSLADPRIYVPVRLRYDKYSKNHPLWLKAKKHLDRLKRINVIKLFDKIVDKNISIFQGEETFREFYGSFIGVYSDIRKLFNKNIDTKIKNNSIQLIVTSPPYPGAQKYIRASTFSLNWLGMVDQKEFRELKSKSIGREEVPSVKSKEALPKIEINNFDVLIRSIFNKNPQRANMVGIYLIEMKEAFKEMVRVLKKNGFLIMVVANNKIAGEEFPCRYILTEIAKSYNLNLILHLTDSIKGRSLLTKRSGGNAPISHESILVFKK